MSFDTIGSVIRELAAEYVRRYGLDDIQQINAGFCGSIADDIIGAWNDEVELCSTPDMFWLPENGRFGGHFWVKLDDLHYDAECPDGVSDWRQLPFFLRSREIHDPTHPNWTRPLSELPTCLEGHQTDTVFR